MTPDEHRNLMVIKELHTRFKIAYILRRKREEEQVLIVGTVAVARHLGQAPAKLRMDNSNELLTHHTVRLKA